jgi:hypothetical protein
VKVLTVYGGRAYEPQIDALTPAWTSSSAPRAGSSTWPSAATWT